MRNSRLRRSKSYAGPQADSSNEATVKVTGVTHEFNRDGKYAPLRVLEDVDLQVTPGSFVSIVGRSGCGKSTLLRIIAGLSVPTRGSAWLGSKRVRDTHPEVGMVFQEDAVFPWRTVRKNVEYGLRAKGIGAKEREPIARKWCGLVGLEDFAHAYPKELSGGMRKRVDLARVYARDPAVLLMDEPLGALDAQTKNRMQEEVLRLWRETGKTVVFVTHDLDEAAFLSDRVLVMSAHPGRIYEAVEIGLARPRGDELRVEPSFLTEKRRLWNALQAANRGDSDSGHGDSE